MSDNQKEEFQTEDIECKQFLRGDEADDAERGISSESKEEVKWGNRLEYLLALIGYTVGISAIWRFPIVCARNGGGAFLIPFITLMVLIGGPLYYLEMCLGQFCGKGPWKSYEFCPIFKGVGLLMVIMSSLVVWYYQTIMAWIIYYIYSSFSLNLAWTTCDNWWNTDQCKEFEELRRNSSSATNLSSSPGNLPSSNLSSAKLSSSSPASEFWFHNVLRQSPDLESLGSIQIHLLVCLILAWVFVNICLIRGVKSIGKVVYVTALFPYVLLTILMVRGVTLDGAGDGILFYITPKFDRILEVRVWLDAALQVFYSLGPMWGGIITMAAFNKFDQPILRDSVIVCCADLFTALYAGVVVFSVVGFMSKTFGIPIEEMAISSGHGLAFIVYPTAVSFLPSPQLWSVLFFLSLLLVILDSIFTMAEVTFMCIIEFLPRRLGEKRYLINMIFSGVFLLAGLVFITNGGIYLFHIFDWYLSSFALLVGAAFEAFMIGNIYGADRFSRDIEAMKGNQLSRITRILVCIVIPAFSVIILMITLSDLTAPTDADGSQYPSVYIWMAIILGLVPIAVMIGIGLMEVITAEGSITQRPYWMRPVVASDAASVHTERDLIWPYNAYRIVTKLSPSTKWAPKDVSMARVYKTKPYRYERTLLRRCLKNIWGSKDTPYI